MFISANSAFAGLDAGRDALKRDDLAAAMQAYKDIAPGDAAWSDKLEDLIRYHLQKSEGQEAWRIVQVGRRTRAAHDEWLDYERLAILKARSCPLSLPSAKEARGLLLDAATYRLQPTMFESASSDVPAGQRGEGHLSPGLTPYLQDIPKTELLAGQGCRFQKQRASNKTALSAAELASLEGYLNIKDADAPKSARLLILIRALELATDLKDTKRVQKLRAQLPPPGEIPWREFPDPERQWLFAQSFGARRFEEIPEAKRAEAQRVALEAVNADDATAYWLAVIDLGAMPVKERRDLLSRAEMLGAYPGRAWVLYELARADYELNEPSEALTVLRRLLVEREETADDTLEEASVDLAARIFSEHQLDTRLEGALMAALPSRMWTTLLQQALLRAALAGRAAEFTRLEKMRDRLHAYFTRTLEDTLARALATRNLTAFKKSLESVKHGYGQEPRLVNFARTLTSFLVENEDVRGLKPYTSALAEKLRSLSYPGSGNAQEIDDLTQLLNDSTSDERSRGSKSVRRGVVKVGVAHRTPSDLKPAVFTLQPPQKMPRRELMYIPDPAHDRGWIFSTAKR